MFSTNEYCCNTLSTKHDSRHNAAETHYVCGACTRVLGEIPKEKRNPIPEWRKQAREEYKY